MPRRPPVGKADLDVILERLRTLEERVARLEGENDAAIAVAADFRPAATPAPPPAVDARPAPPARAGEAQPLAAGPTVPAEEISEETLLVIAASVAAFLGERAHVRQVRLLHSDAWAQQGRVSVMASHRWAVHR
jgi:methylmalonyl-CoA carboxyltransferase 12S subunit